MNIVLVTSAILLSYAGAGVPAATSQPVEDSYWVGPSFAGIPLTATKDGSFVYGDCKQPAGEGGCRAPLVVQTATSCERNPIGIDTAPKRVFVVRERGLAAEYETTAIDIGIGGQTVSIFTNQAEMATAAVREIRLRSQSTPMPLAPPVYPRPVLRELKRVTVAEERFGGIEAISREIDLPPADVRLRLRVAELLGEGALGGIRAPRMSTGAVERLRQLAFEAQLDGPVGTAKRHGMSVATLLAKIKRVRGLAGTC